MAVRLAAPRYIVGMLTTHRRALSVAVTASLLASCGTPSAPPPAVTLGPAADTLALAHPGPSRAVWLGGDRWAVLALTNRVVDLVDFGTRAVAPLGGGDSTVIRNPSAIFALADTLYVNDWGLRRTTLWHHDGTLLRTISADSMLGGISPQARDGGGGWYVELSPPSRPDGSGNRDSAAIVRFETAATRPDTVARLAPLDIAEVSADRGRRFERRIFSGTDEWGTSSDGSIWVARVFHNRVDWRAPDGRWTEGRSLPDRVLEVTRYDREMFVRNFPPDMRVAVQRLPFAPIKPPFDDAFGTEAGDVWLVKSRAPSDSAGQYHVVDRNGVLRRDLRVAGRGRAIGASAGAVVVVETTPEGARLLRFVIPAIDTASESRR